jgi:predicted GNAT family N-acyltransferase
MIETRRITFGSPLYDEILNIRRSVFIEEQNISEDLEIDSYEQECTYFLTSFNGKPAGTGRLRIYGNFIKFERVATKKSLRGKGVATDLMQTMLQYAQSEYPELVPFMHAQSDSVGFYRKLGWIEVGEPFIEADIPHQVMTYT